MTSISPDYSKLGFIGIGAMGQRIALRLLKSGFRVAVFDRNPAKAKALLVCGAMVTALPALSAATTFFSA